MKKNLLRKLTLSAVTMGVAALSVTTSTFAWFTTNGTATANTIEGTVQASDILFMIASPTWSDAEESKTSTASYEKSTYTSSVTLTQENYWNGSASTAYDGKNLYPVAIAGNANATNVGSFTSVNDNHKFDKTADRSYYIYYQVRFGLSQMNKAKTTTVKMDFSGLNVSAAGSQTLLADAGSADSAKKGQTVTRTIGDVLSLGINNTYTTTGTFSNDATGYYHCVEEKETDGCNAHEYYNNIFGLTENKVAVPTSYLSNYKSAYFGSWTKSTSTDSSSSTTTTDGSYTLFSVKGVESIEVTTDFYFFIDGWDVDCFNCVGGLSFSADSINFTATQA